MTRQQEELVYQLETLARLARVAAEDLRTGDASKVRVSRATADLGSPSFGHILLGHFRIHVGAPAVIDVEAVRVDPPPAAPHSS